VLPLSFPIDDGGKEFTLVWEARHYTWNFMVKAYPGFCFITKALWTTFPLGHDKQDWSYIWEKLEGSWQRLVSSNKQNANANAIGAVVGAIIGCVLGIITLPLKESWVTIQRACLGMLTNDRLMEKVEEVNDPFGYAWSRNNLLAREREGREREDESEHLA
jgi:hypothetical protein